MCWHARSSSRIFLVGVHPLELESPLRWGPHALCKILCPAICKPKGDVAVGDASVYTGHEGCLKEDRRTKITMVCTVQGLEVWRLIYWSTESTHGIPPAFVDTFPPIWQLPFAPRSRGIISPWSARASSKDWRIQPA